MIFGPQAVITTESTYHNYYIQMHTFVEESLEKRETEVAIDIKSRFWRKTGFVDCAIQCSWKCER